MATNADEVKRVPVKHRLEHAGFLLARGGARVLPLAMAYPLFEALALAAQDLGGWRKRETRDRIAQVFPDLPRAERERIRREAVRNLARNLVEVVKGPDSERGTNPGLEETLEAFRTARKTGRGILLVIAHCGNWEQGGVRIAREGFPMCYIARRQKNDLTYDALVQTREQSGGKVVDRDDPKLIRQLLAFLADNGMVAILVDIRARTPSRAWEFLGRTAWLSNGLGLLAAKSGAEVVTVYLGREGRHRHPWKVFPARRLEPGASREARDALLQGCLDDLGAEILRHPESYFWFNKRWVLQDKD